MVNAVVYTDAKGRPYRFTEGYRLVILADMATTLPIAATLMPASGDEREALLTLLEKLFEAWPECPMSAIVGDGLFQNSRQLSRDLVFNYGLQSRLRLPQAGDRTAPWRPRPAAPPPKSPQLDLRWPIACGLLSLPATSKIAPKKVQTSVS